MTPGFTLAALLFFTARTASATAALSATMRSTGDIAVSGAGSGVCFGDLAAAHLAGEFRFAG